MGVSQNRLTRDIGVPPRHINEIVLSKRANTADTAPTIGALFRHFPEGFWMGLRSDYDIEEARTALGARLTREVRHHATLKSPVFDGVEQKAGSSRPSVFFTDFLPSHAVLHGQHRSFNARTQAEFSQHRLDVQFHRARR